ncbi:MAG TPA: hypothetical protein VGH89_02450, partial [Pseudonocardia sp.]
MQKVVTLVDHDRRIRTLGRWSGGARGGGLPQPGQQQRPHQTGTVRPQLPLRQPSDQHPTIQNLTQIKRGPVRTQQIPSKATGEHRPQPRHQ